MLKSLAVDGADPLIDYYRRGAAASAMDATELTAVGPIDARHVHVTGILPALSAGCRELAFTMVETARAHGRRVSFDPNLRTRLWPSQEEMVATISGLLEGMDLAAAARRGNAIGARMVQFPGDSDGLPTRRELDDLAG